MITRLLLMIALWVIIDFYVFQAVKVAIAGVSNPIAKKITYWIYWLSDAMLIAVILYVIITGDFAHGPPKGGSLLMGLMILSLAPKLLITPILLIEDILRSLNALIGWIMSMFSSGGAVKSTLFVERRKFISQLALALGAIPFLGIIHGMAKGKYNYTVHKVKLAFKDLPEAFHGFTITQLSDIHSGSFDDPEQVKRGIQIANEQNSDVIFFTGDLVNNTADEMNPWIESFSKLKAPMGKFSILGNHDYGDYVQWESETAKAENLVKLKNVHQEIGFKLLLNENLSLEKDGQKISLIGVENWGTGGFAKYGDLNLAMTNVEKDNFKILLSHDPSHWEQHTLKHPNHIHLTLAGHTHGMQFGFEVAGLKWSPVKYRYPQWAGLYQRDEKYIYVNRGFGFIGFPGRVGIFPEITVITLERA